MWDTISIVNPANDARRAWLLISLAMAILFASDVHAQQPFSAAISGYLTAGCYFLASPVYIPSAEWVVSAYPRTFPTWTDDVRAIDSADGQNVFAVLRTYSSVQIVKLDFHAAYPNKSRQPFFEGLPGYQALDGFAVARNGRVFAAVASSGESRLAVITSSGALESLLNVTITGNMAVAADGCTLFFGDRNTIRRVNGCTGASLPSFVSLDRYVTDVAVLSNGNVLATGNNSLLQFDAAGNLVRTFAIRAIQDLNLEGVAVSPNERAVVVAAMAGCDSRGEIIALSMSDGNELWRRETAFISTATGVVVGADVTPIPGLSGFSLLVFAVALAAIGLAACRT